MKTLTVEAADGFPLAVQTSGPDDGPPLLLLQGQANSHAWWAPLRAGFDDTYLTITFDYRGTGHSRGPVGPWSTSSFAADAADVLAALGVHATSVYGTSMGGRVAQMLAIEHPDLVSGLALACTSPGGRHAVERGADIRQALADPDVRRRLRALHDLFYTPAWPQRRSTLFGDPTMSAMESRAHLRASAGHDAWDALAEIAAPTLVLHGSDDRMVPADNAPTLCSRIPGAVLQLHQGGRHGFFEEFAETITPAVRAFL